MQISEPSLTQLISVKFTVKYKLAAATLEIQIRKAVLWEKFGRFDGSQA